MYFSPWGVSTIWASMALGRVSSVSQVSITTPRLTKGPSGFWLTASQILLSLLPKARVEE